MTNQPPHTVRVDSGKYTFVKRLDKTAIQILRHGEPWHEQSAAFNAIASIMAELDAARVVIKVVRHVLAEGFPLATRGLLDTAMAAHASLVDDRELPSDWCAVPRLEKQEPPPKPDPAASGGPNVPAARSLPWQAAHAYATAHYVKRNERDAKSDLAEAFIAGAAYAQRGEPSHAERQPIPVVAQHAIAPNGRWATTTPRADAIAGSEANIDGMLHTIEGDCCKRTGCLSCAGTDSKGNGTIRHQQPIYGGIASVCERCPEDAWWWHPAGTFKHEDRIVEGPIPGPGTVLNQPSPKPPHPELEQLATRARQWAAADRAADDRMAELEIATEKCAAGAGGDYRHTLNLAYTEAQARARIACKVMDDTREWLLEAARALAEGDKP